MRVDGLFVARQRIAVGPAVVRLLPCLPAVCQGLVPDLAPQGMVGEPSDLVGQAVSIEPSKGLDDAGVQGPSPLRKQTAVGYLMGEGVLEGEGEIGEEAAPRTGTLWPVGGRGHGGARPRVALPQPARGQGHLHGR